MSKSLSPFLAAALLAGLSAPATAEKLGLGRAALPEEIAAWDLVVLPDGTGLPEGQGDVATGEAVFLEKCASCHGEFAEGVDRWPILAGGDGSLQDVRPVKTIGSYWPHLSTLFDYNRRSMPFGAAQSLSNDEVYAITAFLLYSNYLVEDDFVLSKTNFTETVMPNAKGFLVDDRPETEYPLFSAAPCMENCRKSAPEITRRAADLNVTPEDPDGRPAGSLPPITVSQAEVTASELIETGKTVFRACAACHQTGPGANNATGPNLTGVLGRPAGAVDGFEYSESMVAAGSAGLVWDKTNLEAYLTDPQAFIPKSRTAFPGLKSAEDRAAVIAYLATFEG